jgi:hypothetical protein
MRLIVFVSCNCRVDAALQGNRRNDSIDKDLSSMPDDLSHPGPEVSILRPAICGSTRQTTASIASSNYTADFKVRVQRSA